jgi:hypothetical protein
LSRRSKLSQPDPETVTAVSKLLKADDSQLYETLAMRAQAIDKSPELRDHFDVEIEYDAQVMGPKEVLQEAGQKILKRWNKETYTLVCGADAEASAQRGKLLSAVGIGGSVAAASYLASALALIPGLAPALAAVLAVIIWKRYVSPAGQEFCDVWKGHLD